MKFDDEDQQINDAIPSQKIERINIITPKKLENIDPGVDDNHSHFKVQQRCKTL